jgi:hypothetical protein
MSTSTRKQVLVLGIIHYVDEKADFVAPADKIQQALDAEVIRASDAGFDVEIFEVNPNIADNVDKLKVKLHDKQWDAVAIGGGVRFTKHLTPLFETTVNMCIEEVQPLKLIFPVGPTGILESTIRLFGKQVS